MGYQEDNEREIGKMTLERLRMRQQVDAEYRKTVEQQAETRAIVAALKEQQARFGVAPPPAPPRIAPQPTPIPQQKSSVVGRFFASVILSGIVTAGIGAVLCYRFLHTTSDHPGLLIFTLIPLCSLIWSVLFIVCFVLSCFLS